MVNYGVGISRRRRGIRWQRVWMCGFGSCYWAWKSLGRETWDVAVNENTTAEVGAEVEEEHRSGRAGTSWLPCGRLSLFGPMVQPQL